MNDALYWLLGVEPKDWAEGGSWSLRWLGAPHGGDTVFLILLASLAVIVLFWWLYKREGGVMKARTRYTLLSLRVILGAIVLAMLLEPALVLSRIEQRPSEMLVLIDTSQSMGLSDAWIDPTKAQAAVQATGLDNVEALSTTPRIDLVQGLLDSGLLDELEDEGSRNVHLHRFDERLGGAEIRLAKLAATTTATPDTPDPEDPLTNQPNQTNQANALKLGGRSTAIGEAISQLLLAYEGQNIAGVMLLTDGQNTTPGSLSARAGAELARETGVPIFPVAVATPQGPRNAQAVKLEGNDVMFVNDAGSVTAVITARGLKGEPATLVLEKLVSDADNAEDQVWEQVDVREIELAADATPRRYKFDLLPKEKETIIYRARLEEVEGEIDPGRQRRDQAGQRHLRQDARALHRRLHLPRGAVHPQRPDPRQDGRGLDLAPRR